MTQIRSEKMAMACKGYSKPLLLILNIVMFYTGCIMMQSATCLLQEWDCSELCSCSQPPVIRNPELLTLGRPMLTLVPKSESTVDTSPSDRLFSIIFGSLGTVLLISSIIGVLAAEMKNGCCLSCYSFFVGLLILVELASAAYIFFYHGWKDAIPVDKTGNFDMIYNFLKDNWKIAKWVALGALIFEALLILLALMVRAAKQPDKYDSVDKCIGKMSGSRQPLLKNRHGVPASGVPVSADLDQHSRDKYGLDTSEFKHNPSDPSRLEQGTVSPAEGRDDCDKP